MIHSNLNPNIKHSVIVGNGSTIPVTASGSSSIPSNSRLLSLNQVLVTPQIVKNLISVRKFTKDNWCSVEFDPFSFSLKDLQTRQTLLRSNSSGELYPISSSFHQPLSSSIALLASPSLWHKRLGHTNNATLRSVISSNSIRCNKDSLMHSCTAFQIGKAIKLPFF